MNVNFFLKDKNKAVSSVLAIMRYKGNRFKLTTGISVEVRFWEKATHRAKKSMEYPEHDVINIQLNDYEIKLKTVLNNAERAGRFPSIEEFKAAIHPEETPTDAKQNSGFLTYFKKYTLQANYKNRTFLSYGTTANMIEKYERQTRHILQFEDINIDFYTQFRHWFLSQTKPETKNEHYSINYFGTLIKHIKTVMRESGPEGAALHNSTEYKHRKFIKETEEADTVYLNTDELTKIQNCKITYESVSLAHPDLIPLHVQKKVEALTTTRNLFLIGCYTALRISDFARLDASNVSDKYIRIKPMKGTRKNEDVVIPIHPVIAEILAAGFDWSHHMSHQRLNDHLKELCQLSGIKEPVTTIRTEGGRQISRTLPKYKLISSHTARRSGATNMFIAGIPAISIMKITGHRTERSFMKYIKISQEENARLLAEHSFFKR